MVSVRISYNLLVREESRWQQPWRKKMRKLHNFSTNRWRVGRSSSLSLSLSFIKTTKMASLSTTLRLSFTSKHFLSTVALSAFTVTEDKRWLRWLSLSLYLPAIVYCLWGKCMHAGVDNYCVLRFSRFLLVLYSQHYALYPCWRIMYTYLPCFYNCSVLLSVLFKGPC